MSDNLRIGLALWSTACSLCSIRLAIYVARTWRLIKASDRA